MRTAMEQRFPISSHMRLYFFLFHCYHVVVHASTVQNCERLKTSLTYTQEEAPRDLSGVLPVVVERINRVLEGVVDVEVEWTGGDLHGRVGEHFVRCKVTRLASVITGETVADETFFDDDGREVASQCFHVPFTIMDTNECKLPVGHAMRHVCHESSMCVNTIGSYECLCPRVDELDSIPETTDANFWTGLASQDRGSWELAFDMISRTTCPSKASTYGCCPTKLTKGEAASCRADFRCPTDPCSLRNTCSQKATCVRTSNPSDDPNYECACPHGLMGSGQKCKPGIDAKPEPKVMFDGETPTELTLKNNLYCDCTKPVVDACSGFPPCKGKHQICTVRPGNQPTCTCKSGYVLHEKYGCVDESPPILRLKHDPNGDQILRLKQGDYYKEHAVDIQDENAEEYLRSLKIAYSHPLPHGCLTKIGEFHVNYTVATPWTSPPYVRITRRVIIDDIDECMLDVSQYAKFCPDLVPQCDTAAGATCINTIGSYTCKCPKYTSGDGYLGDLSFGPMNAPEGFQGGTGCRDTGKPILQLVGPNPKVFRVCECAGISGIIGQRKEIKNTRMKNTQQSHYSNDIKDVIKETAGAELCATYSNVAPNASDCITAYDLTFQKRVDLSKEVVVGEPVQKSPLLWSVPYDVKDKAGNAAVTVWRDVVVEEVDISELEPKIRKEVVEHQKRETQIVVNKALEADRKKRGREPATTNKRDSTADRQCPVCDCSKQFDESTSNSVCNSRMASCTGEGSFVVLRMLIWFERALPPTVAQLVVSSILLFSSFIVLRFFLTRLLNPSHSSYRSDTAGRREVHYSVSYSDRPNAPPAPSEYLSDRNGSTDGFFSPREHDTPFGSPLSTMHKKRGEEYGDIYLDSPANSIITPNKRGDGVRKRSPYSSNQGIR